MFCRPYYTHYISKAAISTMFWLLITRKSLNFTSHTRFIILKDDATIFSGLRVIAEVAAKAVI